MNQGDNHHYNKSTQPLASELRHNMTEAEIFLWTNVLRNSVMKGYPFRRQRPVLKWIADFMCLELKLIIEVDGSIHASGSSCCQGFRKRNRTYGSRIYCIALY